MRRDFGFNDDLGDHDDDDREPYRPRRVWNGIDPQEAPDDDAGEPGSDDDDDFETDDGD